MSKSIHAIAAMGILGCVALSLIMKNLVEVSKQRASPQLQQLLEAKFAAQLTAPLRLRQETVNGRERLVASACVTAGLAKDRFAEAVGTTLWQQVSNDGDTKTKDIEVLVSDERGGPPVTFMIPRPRPSKPLPAPR